jgi:diguanylate cyclase (GGDEF)-like protein
MVHNGDPPTSESALPGGRLELVRRASSGARRASSDDQTASDADQTASDADQASSDVDQTASESDQAGADRDQRAAAADQAAADGDRAASHRWTPAEEKTYESSRVDREHTSLERLGNRLRRQSTARDRDHAATDRDLTAGLRDEWSRGRDASAAELTRPSSKREGQLVRELEKVRARAAAARLRSAEDRAQAAMDREAAAHERARLETELEAANLDDLTGVYRREMGRLVLKHEIDRARRADGRLVVAFVDVDGLKGLNDTEGHAAGDRVLQSVVRAMRARLRSFDLIIRYGGDEFVCGLSGTDMGEAERRFDSIGVAIRADVRVGISVGLADLLPGDTAETLTERADAAMLEMRAARRRDMM